MRKKRLLDFVMALLFLMSNFIASPVLLAHDEDELPPGNELDLTDSIGGLSVSLDVVATGLTAPNWGTTDGVHDGRLYVTDQPGTLWAIDLTTGGPVECPSIMQSLDCKIFLDVSGLLVELGIGGVGTFDERGLLGVAFHPDYANNGLLYTYTSEPVDGPADFSTIPVEGEADHQTVIREWEVSSPILPGSVVDPTSSRELLRIDQPQFNHNGGAVNFGPDGMLYISLGDGGSADDQGVGHGTDGNGQNTSNILGALIRIDPLGDNSANGNYGIPADNPFVGQPGFVEEIFAYGFRNPFRFSFDKATGDLYVGDVGQNDIEEVDVVVAGGNYGWRLKEGSFFFTPDPGVEDDSPCNTPDEDPPGLTGCATDIDPGDLPTDLIDPIAQYDTHTDGHSVIGGFVYRGSEIPELVGRYVFGDFGLDLADEDDDPPLPLFREGRLFLLNKRDGVGNTIHSRRIQEFRGEKNNPLNLGLNVDGGGVLLGFGQDASGELYVLANATSVPFNGPPDAPGTVDPPGDPTGVVLRIVPKLN